MQHPKPKTWVGGSRPDLRFVDVSLECQAYMIDLYKEGLARCAETDQDSISAEEKGVIREFAKLDAWATFYQN